MKQLIVILCISVHSLFVVSIYNIMHEAYTSKYEIISEMLTMTTTACVMKCEEMVNCTSVSEKTIANSGVKLCVLLKETSMKKRLGEKGSVLTVISKVR